MRRILLFILAGAMLVAPACSGNSTPGGDELAAARAAYAQGLYLESEAGYERYLQREPQGAFRREAWERLVEVSLTIKKDLDQAAVLQEAMFLELGSDTANAWPILFRLGDTYDQLGNKAKALETFEKCMTFADNDPERLYQTQLRMAELFRSQGNFTLVVETLEHCADLAVGDEEKAKCLYKLGQSYGFISSWNQAQKTLESALELKQLSEESRALIVFLLADMMELQGDIGKARELLLSIQNTYPNPKVIESRLNALIGQ